MSNAIGILREIYNTCELGDTNLRDALGELYDEIGEVLNPPEWYCEAEGCGKRYDDPMGNLFGHGKHLYCQQCYDNLASCKNDEEYQQANTAINNVLTKWPDWKRDTLLSIFNLTLKKPKGKPAVQFEVGEFFKAVEHGLCYMKAWFGAIYLDHKGEPNCVSISELEEMKNCHPCEPDFKIVPVDEMEAREEAAIKELDEVKEGFDALAIAVGKYFGEDVGEHSSVNCPITNAFDLLRTVKPNDTPDHPDNSDDSTPEDDAVRELIDMAINFSDPYTISDLMDVAENAHDQYERMKEDNKNLDLVYAIGRHDGKDSVKPTIPQEVRELMDALRGLERSWQKGHNVYFNSDLSTKTINALQSIERCEVAKPHPLTQVRELVEVVRLYKLDDDLKDLNMFKELWAKCEAARKELAEYDGDE